MGDHPMTRRSPTQRTMTGMDDGRLEVSAALVQRLLEQGDGRIVALWEDPRFSRSVDTLRRQLAPIRDRSSLRASYAREAGRARGPGAAMWITTSASVALEIAYAMRWRELAFGRPSRPFISMVTRSSSRQAIRRADAPRGK